MHPETDQTYDIAPQKKEGAPGGAMRMRPAFRARTWGLMLANSQVRMVILEDLTCDIIVWLAPGPSAAAAPSMSTLGVANCFTSNALVPSVQSLAFFNKCQSGGDSPRPLLLPKGTENVPIQ